MNHFANFNIRAGLDAVKKVGSKVAGLNSVKIGAGVGAAAGLAKGAGVGESEEEKSKTTALGRVGKLVGNTAAGGVVGGSLGLTASDLGKGVKRQYKKSEIELTPAKISNNSYGYNPNANFAPMLDNSPRYLKNIRAGGMAVGDVFRGLGNEVYRPTQIAAGIGAAAGLARGAGIGESEEEKANTTALGRAGKVFGKTAAGAAIGGTLGLGGQTLSQSTKYAYSRRRPEYDVSA